MLFPTWTKFYLRLGHAGKNLPQENFRVAAGIFEILAANLIFLQHTRIFL